MGTPSILTTQERIDPRRVMNRRRRLHFSSLKEVLEEADRLTTLAHGQSSQHEDLAAAGARVVHIGNMPLGQALGHLGLTLEFSVKPLDYTFPLPMRMMARLMKARMLAGRIAAPFEQPPALNKQITPGFDMTSAEGLDILHKAVHHFERAKQLQPNALFGELSHAEWVQLTCRHAEWHLGFMRILGGAAA